MSNDPLSPVTAKNGWSSTPTQAFIQLCTSHLNGTMISGVSNVRSKVMPWIGCPVLNSSLFAGVA